MKPFLRWRRFEPFDSIPLTGALLAVIALATLGPTAWGLLAFVGLLVVSLPVWTALTIGPEQIVLDRCWWFVPIKRKRYRSDASVSFYESLEADAPEALFIDPIEISGDSDPFAWPMSQAALARLQSDCVAAVQSLRERRLASAPADLLLLPEPLSWLRDSLDLHTAERNRWGRVMSVRALREVTLGGVVVAPRSLLTFDANQYRDHETPDRLRLVHLVTPALVTAVGRTTRDGARLSLDENGVLTTILDGFDGIVDFGGWPLVGEKPIGLERDGTFRSGTLGAAHRLGRWLIPAESGVSGPFLPAVWPAMFGRPRWSVTLGAPLPLPEVELRAGDRISFDAAGAPLSFAVSRPFIELAGGTVATGSLSVPVDDSGFVSRAKCERLKIWKA